MDLWEEHHPQSDKKQKHDEEEEDRASHVSTIATVPSKEADILATQEVLPTPPPSPTATSPSSSPPSPPSSSPPTTTRKQRTTLFWPGRWRPMLALPPSSTPTEKAPIIQNNDNENKDTTTVNDDEATHGMGCLLTLTLVLIITHIYMIYHLVRASRHLAVIESFCK